MSYFPDHSESPFADDELRAEDERNWREHLDGIHYPANEDDYQDRYHPGISGCGCVKCMDYRLAREKTIRPGVTLLTVKR